MERALLLVDVDGVLNPWGDECCPAGFSEYDLFPGDDEPVRLAVIHGAWWASPLDRTPVYAACLLCQDSSNSLGDM